MKLDSEDSIEDWYEKEKEKLEEEHFNALQSGKSSSKAKFEKQLKDAIEGYEQHHVSLWKSQARKEKLSKPVKDFEKSIKSIETRAKKKYAEDKAAFAKKWKILKSELSKKEVETERKIHRFSRKFRKKL